MSDEDEAEEDFHGTGALPPQRSRAVAQKGSRMGSGLANRGAEHRPAEAGPDRMKRSARDPAAADSASPAAPGALTRPTARPGSSSKIALSTVDTGVSTAIALSAIGAGVSPNYGSGVK